MSVECGDDVGHLGRRSSAASAGWGYTEGRTSGHFNDADDALIHFFQDAIPLKDWIKHDELVSPGVAQTVEPDLFCLGNRRDCNGHPLGPLAMRVVADMGNGTKHYKLRPGAARFPDTSFVSSEITVLVGSPNVPRSTVARFWRVTRRTTVSPARARSSPHGITG